MGPEEVAKDEVTVKDLVTRSQENVTRENLIDYLAIKLAQSSA